ncbi:MAG: response regulator [Phycisphaerae bacterium]
MTNNDDRNQRALRQDPTLIKDALDKLDETADRNDQVTGRKTERYSYRVKSLVVELKQQSGDWVRHAVPSRNISRDGLGFLAGSFVYPRTECKIHLVSLHNHKVTIQGEVARCRYLEGTGTLYEVGVRFKRAIDVSMFHRAATKSRMLLIDDDPSIAKLVTFLLKSANVEVTHALDGDIGIKLATSTQPDLVLLDIEMPGKSGYEVAAELTAANFTRPIIAITAVSDPDCRKKCLDAGCSVWLTKPLTREALQAVVNSMRGEPLISSLLHDQGMLPLIDEFVSGLKTRLTQMEQLLAAQNLVDLEKTVRSLKGDAGAYGFGAVSVAADELEKALRANTDAMAVRSKFSVLSGWCLAARPASCNMAAE